MRRLVPLVITTLVCLSSVSPAQTVKTDAHGDPLPPGAVARLGTVRWRAGSSVILAAYRPDGKSLVTVGQDFFVQVWDAATGREIRRFDVSGGTQPATNFERLGGGRVMPSASNSGAAISGDGKVLACVGRDGVVRVWDVDTGKERRALNDAVRNFGRLALSRDGKSLAVAGYPDAVRLWDTTTGAKIRQFGPDVNAAGGLASRLMPYRVEFGPDAKTLFLAGLEIGGAGNAPVLILWDTTDGKELRRIDKLPNNVASYSYKAAVAPDLKAVAFPFPTEILLFDLANGKELHKLKYNADYRTSIAFTPDGKSLMAVTGKGDAVTVWNPTTGEITRQVGTPPEPLVAGVSAGRTLTGMALSPDGATAALLDGPSVVLLDVATGKPRHADAGHSAALKEAYFAPDGKTVVTRAADNSVYRWDPARGVVVGTFTLPGQKGSTPLLLPSPDGRWAVTAESNGTIHVVDAATGKETFAIPGDGNAFSYGIAVRFSPDSRTLATASRVGGTAYLYDVASGKKTADLSLPPPPPQPDPRMGFIGVRMASRRLLFSADSRLIGIGTEGHLTIWDATTGVKVRVLQLPDGQTLGHAAISPNGLLAATEFVGGETALWEVATGTRRLTLAAAPPPAVNDPMAMIMRVTVDANAFPMSMAFSPDGRLLVRAGEDGKARLWDVRTGKDAAALEGHRGAMASAAFSPDGGQLVTGGADTTALVWDMAPVRAKLPPTAADLDPTRVKTLWAALGAPDAGKAHEAILALAGDPVRAVALFREQVKPVATPDPKRLAALVVDLSDVRFVVRERAQRELERLGELAAPVLRDASQNNPAPQVRRASMKLLEALDNRTYPTGQLQSVRAVEVLEMAGTSDAVALLKELADGAPEAAPTPQAKAAVERLGGAK